MDDYVVAIEFDDRPGLGYEVFGLCETHGVDKVDMEAFSGGMVIKIRCGKEQDNIARLLSDLRQVAGVFSVVLRDYMPYEEREKKLQTILDAVGEGIVAVDRSGAVTHINAVAERIFRCKAGDAIGKSYQNLLGPDDWMGDTLRSGAIHQFQEQRKETGRGRVHYVMNSVPVRDDKGLVLGGVATVKDFRQVEEMLRRFDNRRSHITFDNIVFQSEIMRQLVETAKTVACGNATILLLGESGTGKEMFAQAIHYESNRRAYPFVAVNCAALPENLLESELFGFEEGSFTGAKRGGRRGIFEQAHTGTIFLDEIGEISPVLQVRLLRVLQEHSIRRVGGQGEIPVDVRVIAATNRNLSEMVRVGQFREDLYYRLNVIPLEIPPLRDRMDDIALLIRHLARKIAGHMGQKERDISLSAMGLLQQYSWPGNVRQLENVLERVMNVVSEGEITREHLQRWTDLGPVMLSYPADTNRVEREIRIVLPPNGEWPELKTIVGEVEKQVLQMVTKEYPSSRKAGRILGVSNTTILNKLEQYHLTKKVFDDDRN